LTMKTTTAASTNLSVPTHDQIAQRAYLLWENAGHPAGRDQDLWCQAESELKETRLAGTTGRPAASTRAAAPSRIPTDALQS